MSRSRLKFFAILTIVSVGIFLYFYYDLSNVLNLDWLKESKSKLLSMVEINREKSLVVFLLIYVVAVAFSIPGATILTLAAGLLFGLWQGLVLVSFASSIGATLAMLASRFFISDFVRQRFHQRMKSIDKGIEKDGAFYLFSLRLVPLFPFFIINLAMGLTPIKVWTFFWVGQIGMLPGTFVYVNAGTQLGQIHSTSDILSWELALTFALLGIFPLVAKKILAFLKAKRIYSSFKKPKKFDYNLVVIGAGAAGLVSSYMASALKAKVALIEKDKMGGDCLNTGCVPSKALLSSAKIVKSLQQAKHFGVSGADSPIIDFSAVMARVHKIIQKIEPHDSVERYQSLGVDCYSGSAEILTPFEVKVRQRVLKTKSIILATGAYPVVPPFPGLENVSYVTSDTLWSITDLPKRLLVLGGGPIGLELAQAFSRLGSQVVVVEKGPRLISKEDIEVSQFVQEMFINDGIECLLNTEAKSFIKAGEDCILEAIGPDNKSKQVKFDTVLIALGRKSRVSGFGLEKLGVELSADSKLSVDPFQRTNFPNIFCCGDVSGEYQFTHTASHEAWYASINALFAPFLKLKTDYRVIPWCTFLDPEIARVGLSEQEANEKEIEYEVTKYDLSDLDRAITESEDRGFIKVLTAPGKDKILGVLIIGTRASDLIAEFVLAMKYNLGLEKILGTIHLYPSFPEASKFVAGNWKKNHAPQKILSLLERWHAWRL